MGGPDHAGAVGAQVVEQLGLPRQHAGEDQPRHRQQLGHMGAGQGVAHGGAFLTGGDQVGAAQHRQLLRQVRRLDTHLGEHLGHHVLPLAEQLEHPYPGRVAQRLEELRLQLVQRRTHPSSLLSGGSWKLVGGCGRES